MLQWRWFVNKQSPCPLSYFSACIVITVSYPEFSHTDTGSCLYCTKMSPERQEVNLIHCCNGKRRKRDVDMKETEDWKKCAEIQTQMLRYSQDNFSRVIHQHDSSVSTQNHCSCHWILRIKMALHLAVRVLLHFNLHVSEFLFSLIFKHSKTTDLNVSLAVTFSNPHFPCPNIKFMCSLTLRLPD